MTDKIIKLKNVTWYYENSDKPALCNIDLSINKGEFILVLGENGAGKSTFCRLLNGLIPHSITGNLKGAVEIDGVLTVNSTVTEFSKKVGMVFDDASNQLFTARVFDEAAFGPENLMLEPAVIREKVNDALNAVGLASFSEHHPLKLSGGQKQRLAIAAALAMADSILVMDEPESQLDPLGVQDVFSYIKKIHSSRGITIITAANFCDELIKYADRVIVLKNGCLEAFNAPQEIFKDRMLLSDCNLHIPQICEFAFCMEEHGAELPLFPLTPDEACNSVLSWFNK